MIPPDILAKFEAAYFGSLPADEVQDLEHHLRSRPDWQEEIQVYRQLWQGLDALRDKTLRARFQQWDAEAATHDEAELLESYFHDQLSPANRAYVDEKRATDSDFADHFIEYQSLFSGLETLGDTAFRERMAQWGEAPKTSSTPAAPAAKVVRLPTYQRLLAIAASVLVLVVAGLLWRNQAPSPQALLDELYSYPVTGSTLGADHMGQAEYLAAFTAAHQAFQQKDYPQAAAQFTRLSAAVPPASLAEEDIRYYQDNIEWMVVLARYGAGQTEGDFTLRLRSIADNTQHRFQEQAQQLQEEQ